jgi:Peptidase family S41
MRGYPGEPGIQVLAHLTDTTIRSSIGMSHRSRCPTNSTLRIIESGWDVQPEKPHFSARHVFLTEGRAISYAETVMGIVEHYNLGEIVGGPTAGTNGNVNPFKLSGGYVVAWTGMKVLKARWVATSRNRHTAHRARLPYQKGRRGRKDEILLRGLAVVKSGQSPPR